MILDYKNDLDFACENGISVGEYYIYFNMNVTGEEYSDIVFKNFPNLLLKGSTFVNCVFENCDSVEISNGKVKNCTFEGTDNVTGNHTVFDGCTFKNIETDSMGALIIDTSGEVDGCTFENIKVKGDENRVCRMLVDREKQVQYLVNCRFVNCSVEALDGSLSLCSYRTLLGKEKMEENIDYDSCEIV